MLIKKIIIPPTEAAYIINFITTFVETAVPESIREIV